MSSFEEFVKSFKKLGTQLHSDKARENVKSFSRKFEKTAKKGIVYKGPIPKASDSNSKIEEIGAKKEHHILSKTPGTWIPLLLSEVKASSSKDVRTRKLNLCKKLREWAPEGSYVPPLSREERGTYSAKEIAELEKNLKENAEPAAEPEPESKEEVEEPEQLRTASRTLFEPTIAGLGTSIGIRKSRRIKRKKRFKDFEYYGFNAPGEQGLSNVS